MAELKVNIIGFSGKMGSGKNYIGEKILGQKLYEMGYTIHSIAFADQIKYEIACRSHLVTTEIINYEILKSEDNLYKNGLLNILNNYWNNKYPFSHIITYFRVLLRTPCKFIASLMSLNKKYPLIKNTLTIENIYNLVFNTKPVPIRMKLQNHAEERIIDDKIWINSLYLRILNLQEKSYNKKKDVFIITDVRFKNEIEFIKKMGGIVIRINPEIIIENEKDENNKKINSHISEIELDNFTGYDLIINNTFSPDLNINNILHLIF